MARDSTLAVLYPTRGGMIAPHELRILAETAATHGSGSLILTARQEIILPGLVTEAFRPLKQRLAGATLWPVRPGLPPNIVTSCPAVGAEGGRAWLREGVFDDILEGFQTRPMLPVCIADPGQRQMPVSLGVINFHAADREHLWHLQAALPNGEYAVLPHALRTDDLPVAVRLIESILQPNTSALCTEELVAIEELLVDRFTPADYGPPAPLEQYQPLTARHPGGASPCAIAIPALAGRLHCDLLQDLCIWAMRHDLSRIGLTPWKTLVTPAISVSQYRELQRILIHRRVHTEQGPWRGTWYDSSNEASVGKGLRVQLTQTCPTDTGISVAVIGPDDPVPDVHVVVREVQGRSGRFLKSAPRYMILVRDDLDARAPGMRIHAEGLEAAGLAHSVMRLIEDQDELIADAQEKCAVQHKDSVGESPIAWRCGACLTEYREDLGDPLGGVASGTAFDAFPEDWACPTCGESREGFSRVCAA